MIKNLVVLYEQVIKEAKKRELKCEKVYTNDFIIKFKNSLMKCVNNMSEYGEIRIKIVIDSVDKFKFDVYIYQSVKIPTVFYSPCMYANKLDSDIFENLVDYFVNRRINEMVAPIYAFSAENGEYLTDIPKVLLEVIKLNKKIEINEVKDIENNKIYILK